MSDTLIVDLKDKRSSFDKKLNKFANEIVKFCLDNNIAAFFNSDYSSELVKLANMKNYFLVSDSFLYEQCDELLDIAPLYDSTDNAYKRKGAFDKSKWEEHYRDEFYKKFKWFTGLLDIIFCYEVESIDIYIESYESLPLDEYYTIKTSHKNFLKDICDYVIDNAEHWCYHIPVPVKFEVSR